MNWFAQCCRAMISKGNGLTSEFLTPVFSKHMALTSLTSLTSLTPKLTSKPTSKNKNNNSK